MSSRKFSSIFVISFLLYLFSSGLAWATNASITVSGNEGAIPLNASATFTSYEHCDSEDPPNCWYVDSGTLYVYHGSSLMGSASGNGSASWSTTLDGGAMSQGDHAFTATAVDSENGPHATSATITIDNTPEVSVTSPGQVEGEFDFSGSATFKEHVGGDEGTVYLYINKIDKYGFQGSKSYEGTSITWSYSEITGHLLDAGAYSNGEHKIYVYAKAANGQSSGWVDGTFEVAMLIQGKNCGGGSGLCEVRPRTKGPINFSTGNKYQKGTDLRLEGPGLPMGYTKYYNSQSELNGSLGYGWTGTFSESLTLTSGKVILVQADGNEVHFLDDGQGKYISETDLLRVIETIAGGYQLSEPDGRVLTFDSNGKLIQITDRNGNSQILGYASGKLSYVEDNYGRRLDFSYNAEGRLTTLTTPAGEFTYTYDDQENLISVTNPDMTGRTYFYAEPNDPHNLTGITNENGIQSATFTYDDQDRAIVSERAGGMNRVEVSYDDNFVRRLTDSLGRTATFKLQVARGIGRVKSASGSGCESCLTTLGSQYSLNDRLWIESSTDAMGNITTYTHDDRGNILTKTEAAGTPEERTTTYTYHPDYNLITSITRASISNPGATAVTSFTYDASGNLTNRTEEGYSGSSPVTRTTTYTYNALGQITLIDGPRTEVTDVTTFEYYPNDPSQGLNRGMLKKIIDSFGYETSFSQYNAFGRHGESTDANGVITTFSYDSPGRLTSRTTAGYTTSFEYDSVGNLTVIHLPGAREITYTYTSADLLEKIEDNSGNYINYFYNTEGNRVREETHDLNGILKRYTDFEFDDLNRLTKTIYPGGHLEDRGYDDNGNLIELIDANSNSTLYDYDALNRLTNVIQPGNTITSYAYDSHDNLIEVTDAENLTTSYLSDDMGRLVSTTSPDTGATLYTYDPAGNLVLKTDAKGNTATYAYDARNRLTGIYFPDSTQDITYLYDEGINGKGRLTGMSDPAGDTSYQYDALGRLIQKTRIINEQNFTIEYIYNDNGEIVGITYPSGRTITYDRNISGQITSIQSTYEGNTITLAENVAHLPFGPITTMSMGNGQDITHTFDQLYRINSSQAGSVYNRSYTYDPSGNITDINDLIDPSENQSFGYDPLNRLLTATGVYGPISYTYDKVGNRLTRADNGQTETYSYITGTNKLLEITGTNPATFTYDANGNTTDIGDKSFIYNQNNRLIQVTEGSTTLDEYIYNGQGQRIKKVTQGETTIFIYDQDGNLITEVDENGKILKEYVYLEGRGLAQFAYEIPEEIGVSVTTSKGRELSGINVYAFTESGSYTGLHAVTNDQGVASFSPEDFTDGNYKFRADYLSYQFWSPIINIPGTYSTQVLIEEETAEVTVTVAGEEKEGVNVYLFNEGGSYLGVYQVTDTEGKVSFDLPVGKSFTFRADHMGNQYWSDTTVIGSGGTTPINIDTGGGILTVTIRKDADHPIVGINVYLFSSSGSYLGHYDTTNENGQVSFTVSGGDYKVRADYLGYQFWSDVISVNENTSSTLTIPHQDVTITVEGDYDGDIEPRENLNIYLFTPSGSYLSQYQVTNDQGQVTFNLPEKDYKVRADYLSQQYFSDIFNWTDTTITINEGIAEVTVTNMGLPLDGVNVYVFNNSGSYLSIYDVTDIDGKVFFRLPSGDYNFRGDYMGSQYWSGVSTIIAHVENPVNISTGGGSFTLTVLKAEEDPLIGVNCYLFSESGSYLGEHGVANDQGEVGFNLSDGTYKIRVDYLGYQFWTEVFSVPNTSSLTYTIAHQDVTITVEGDYDGDIEPRVNLNVYLFSPSGSYLSQYKVTNAQGQVIFNLPEKDYKVRADYLSQQYWSNIFNWTDTTITINEGLAEVHMLQGSIPLENVNVYVFTSSGSYLGIYGQTNTDGIVNFRLPEGTYTFRGDYQGSQYWATEPVNAHQVNVINLNTGGGTFTLTVNKETGIPLINIPVYVFTSGGSYLGISGHTDDEGKVSFDLSDGDYKFRADYLGYQFWSDVSTIPNTLSDTLTIPHQDVTITVNEVYGADSDPLESINVYLFTASGSYMSQYQVTNEQGQVTFNVPQEDYKVRADYLSGQYFSDTFNWMDTEVDIDHGLIDLHVTFNGEDVFDAPIYLFTESGSYLGRYERTGYYGHVQFLIPSRSYKFRVDYEGTQYWSDVVNIIAHEETDVELPLEQLALNFTNDPNPVRFDGKPPVFRPEQIRVASIGSLVGILSQTVVANTSSPRVYYYLNDHLGTPQVITDENGEVVWKGDYRPFGDANVDPAFLATNRFRFPGQYYDQETGLHYNYHRYYDPRMGRYLTPDPIGLMANLNLYGYADQNPINRFDPRGLYRDVGGGFGLTAGIVGVSASIHTESCCDDQGRKHVRTVRTVCIGLELGLGLKGGSHVAISDVKKPGKCPKMYDESGYYSEQQGVWGALVVGREYSITEKSGGWKFGFGGGWAIYSGCRNDILKDVTVGKCCDQ